MHATQTCSQRHEDTTHSNMLQVLNDKLPKLAESQILQCQARYEKLNPKVQ